MMDAYNCKNSREEGDIELIHYYLAITKEKPMASKKGGGYASRWI
jgi:hypothetical protein